MFVSRVACKALFASRVALQYPSTVVLCAATIPMSDHAIFPAL
jgi:hypothetical protein